MRMQIRILGPRIRDGKNSDPGSGINIPDPQHCLISTVCAGLQQEQRTGRQLWPGHRWGETTGKLFTSQLCVILIIKGVPVVKMK